METSCVCHATCGIHPASLRVSRIPCVPVSWLETTTIVDRSERRHNVLIAGRHEGNAPQHLARDRVDAEDLAVDLDDEVLLAGERRQDRGGVARAVALQSPLLVARNRIEGNERASLVSARMHDQEAARDQRGHGSPERRRRSLESSGEVLLPDDATVRGIEASEDPADPQGEEPAFVEDGCRLWPAAVRSRAGVDPVGSGIPLAPQCSARSQIKSAGHFHSVFAREHEHSASRDHGARLAAAHREPPPLRELIRPAVRRRGRLARGVAIRATPLRPIPRVGRRDAQYSHEQARQHSVSPVAPIVVTANDLLCGTGCQVPSKGRAHTSGGRSSAASEVLGSSPEATRACPSRARRGLRRRPSPGGTPVRPPAEERSYRTPAPSTRLLR